MSAPILGQGRRTGPASRTYIHSMKEGGFGSAITSGTTVHRICRIGRYDIVYYDNRPPRTGHENTGIVLFRNGSYVHDYSADVETCHCRGRNLVCGNIGMVANDVVPLADVIRGRHIHIGGALENAWRRGKALDPLAPFDPPPPPPNARAFSSAVETKFTKGHHLTTRQNAAHQEFRI